MVDTEIVELKLTPVHSGGSCYTFDVKPYMRKALHVGNDAIDENYPKALYPHLEPIGQEDLQLRRCRNDTGSGRVSINPLVGVF